MIALVRRMRGLSLAPVLAAIALMAWVLASPVGAGPDDDFHLVSSWCAGPTADKTCVVLEAGEGILAPQALVEIACFAFDPAQSAACQREAPAWSMESLVQTGRSNVAGTYPPLYYAVTGVLTGDDPQASALAMRVLSVVLFLGVVVSLFVLLPAHRRPTLSWAFLLTAVPLGLFLFGTNNPSLWAWIGVGAAPVALVGYYESEGRRRIGLGALFVVTALMAAGARSDAAIFVCIAIGAIVVTAFERTRRFAIRSILPAATASVALVLFGGAYLARGGASGFTGESFDDPVRGSAIDRGPVGEGGAPTGDVPLTGFGLLASNLLNVTRLWTGVFGDRWGLGWLDTSMPAVVPTATVAALVLVGAAGLFRVSLRRALMIAGVVLVLVVLPTVVLQVGGDAIGEQLQPRYLLPLVALLVVLLTLVPARRPLVLSRVQRFIVIVALSSSYFVALHLNLRRYVTGIDESGPNLDAGIEWWWVGSPVSPNAVWLIGSLAFCLLVTVLVNHASRASALTASEAEAAGRAPVR